MAVKGKIGKAVIYREDLSTAEGSEPIMMRRGQTFSRAILAELAKRFGEGYSDPCRSRIAQRWDLLQHNVRPHVERRLLDTYASDEVRKGACGQITSALNPGADIVGRVCQVYRHGCTRSVIGVTKKKAKALARLYRESGIQALGQDWNRNAYFLGPIEVIPRVRSKRMRLDTVLPHRMVPILDEEDPTGQPLAIAYRYGTRVVLVTQGGTFTYTLKGVTLEPVGTPLSSMAAQEGESPFAELRLDRPLDPSDYLSSHKHQRIVDGTLDVCVIAAVLGFVRKTQNKKLLTLQGFLDSLPHNQNVGNPETPIVLPTPQGQLQSVALQALDFNQDPSHFLMHIRFWYGAMAESTGVPVMVTGDGAGVVNMEFAFDGLSELRDEQIVYCEEFERQLCIAMVIAAIDGGHPVASDLPTIDEIREGFAVTFGDMSRAAVDPLVEQQAIDWRMRHGLTDILAQLRQQNPGMGVDELRKLLLERLENNAILWDWIASRNVGADDASGGATGAAVDASGKVTTAAQRNGAQGPAAKVKDGKAKARGAAAVRSIGGRGKARGKAARGQGRGRDRGTQKAA